MSVPATAKPGRGPRRLAAHVPGAGPRRVDRTRRRHMVLLPECSDVDAPEPAPEGAGRPGGQDGVAARVPIRAIAPAAGRVARPAATPKAAPSRPVASRPVVSPAAASRAAVGRVTVSPVTRPAPRTAPVRSTDRGRAPVPAADERPLGVHLHEALSLVAGQTRVETAPATARPAAAPRGVASSARLDRSPAPQAGPGVANRPGWSFARLPRRGQRLLVAVGFAAAIGLGAVVGDLAGFGAEVPAGTAVVTVEPGESLWQIASATVEPGTDLRPVIDHIRELNALEGSTVVDGQRLIVPAAGD